MSTTSTSLRAGVSATDEQQQSLAMLLRALKLPTFAAHHEELARRAGQEGWTCPHYLRQQVESELEQEKLPAKVRASAHRDHQDRSIVISEIGAS